MNIDKTIRIGRGIYGDVFCRVVFNNDRLSITGVEGPRRGGDCRGSCGQIEMGLNVAEIEPAPGWDRAKIERFVELWRRWHLNDMRPGCEHQVGDAWKSHDVEVKNVITKRLETKRSSFVRVDEHPDGLLCKPCSVCGYKYGTEWKFESVPADVLDELRALPDTDMTPAWI